MTEIEALKRQNEEFHLTVLTRLARMHHILEDLQDLTMGLNIITKSEGTITFPLRTSSIR